MPIRLAPLGRFVLFNPCFVLALLLCTVVWLSPSARRPRDLFDSNSPAEVIGWVSGPVQQMPDYDYLELTPTQLNQREKSVTRYPGRIGLYIRRTSAGRVQALLYGDVIRVNTYLEEPSHYEVPGAVDYREYLWQQGVVQLARLKSPLQITRAGIQPGTRWLRPIFSYCRRFEEHCRDHLSPAGLQFVLSLFLGRGKSLQAIDVDDLKRLGILHIFVVSGSHVSLVLLYLHFVFGWTGRSGRVLTLAGVWAYILLVGCSPPVLRSGLMTSIAYLMLAAGLGRQLLNVLGLSALLLLAWFPPAANGSSFQLSYLSLCAIGLFVLPADACARNLIGGMRESFTEEVSVVGTPEAQTRRYVRFLIEQHTTFFPRRPILRLLSAVSRLAGALSGIVLCSVFVPLLLLPVCLQYSNCWVWTQSLSNVLFVPLFSVVVPACLLLFLAFWVPGARFLTWLIGVYSTGLMGFVDRLADLAWVDEVAQPHTLVTLVYLLGLPAVFLGLKGRKKSFGLMAPLILFLFLKVEWPAKSTSRLSLTLLDVGQSESLHIRYPDGTNALIDTGGSLLGPASAGDFIGQRVVSRYLWGEGCRRLAFVLLTHAHADHDGGFRYIKRAFPMARLYYGAWQEAYRGPPARQLKGGDCFRIAGVEHRVLHPGRALASIPNLNDQSVVVLVRYGRFSALLTGDITAEVEEALSGEIPRVTILKLAHHGSRNSNSDYLLRPSCPTLAVVSAGRRNSFGHPSAQTLARLQEAGTPWLSTSQSGSIRIETDGRRCRVQHYTTGTGRFETVREHELE